MAPVLALSQMSCVGVRVCPTLGQGCGCLPTGPSAASEPRLGVPLGQGLLPLLLPLSLHAHARAHCLLLMHAHVYAVCICSC